MPTSSFAELSCEMLVWSHFFFNLLYKSHVPNSDGPVLPYLSMFLSKLAKIPLVVLGSVCCEVYLSSPNTPDADEEAKYNTEHKLPDAVPLSNVLAPKLLKVRIGPYGNVTLEVSRPSSLLWQVFCHIINAFEILAMIFVVYPEVAQLLALPWLDKFLSHTGEKVHISGSFVLGTIMSSVGTLIRIACYRHLGRQFTFHLSIRKGHKLVTSGPYSVVRHPGYISVYICMAGTTFCQFGAGSFWRESGLWDHPTWKWFGWLYIGYRLYANVALFMRIEREDTVLRREFEDEWVTWAKKTPYKLIPFVY